MTARQSFSNRNLNERWVGRVLLQLDLHVVTEVGRQRDAVDVLAPVAVGDGHHVEDDDEEGEQPHGGSQADDNADELPPAVKRPKGNVRHEGEGQEEAEKEAENVGPVVEPGQEAEDEEYEQGEDHLEAGQGGPAVHLVALEDLHQEAGGHTKLGTRRTHLGSGEEVRMFTGIQSHCI